MKLYGRGRMSAAFPEDHAGDVKSCTQRFTGLLWIEFTWAWAEGRVHMHPYPRNFRRTGRTTYRWEGTICIHSCCQCPNGSPPSPGGWGHVQSFCRKDHHSPANDHHWRQWPLPPSLLWWRPPSPSVGRKPRQSSRLPLSPSRCCGCLSPPPQTWCSCAQHGRRHQRPPRGLMGVLESQEWRRALGIPLWPATPAPKTPGTPVLKTWGTVFGVMDVGWEGSRTLVPTHQHRFNLPAGSF